MYGVVKGEGEQIQPEATELRPPGFAAPAQDLAASQVAAIVGRIYRTSDTKTTPTENMQ